MTVMVRHHTNHVAEPKGVGKILLDPGIDPMRQSVDPNDQRQVYGDQPAEMNRLAGLESMVSGIRRFFVDLGFDPFAMYFVLVVGMVPDPCDQCIA